MTDPDLRARFIEGMSRAASSVYVITTDGAAGRKGLTASAMTSVSADTAKPSLLICVNKSSRSAPAILENGVFCVNLLCSEQQQIAELFARRTEEDRFAQCDWVQGPTGSPMLSQALVSWDCKITKSELVGTHYVLIGEAEEVRLADPQSPLVYGNRRWLDTSARG